MGMQPINHSRKNRASKSSYIYPMIQFWTKTFKLTKATINKVIHVCSNFLWKGKAKSPGL